MIVYVCTYGPIPLPVDVWLCPCGEPTVPHGAGPACMAGDPVAMPPRSALLGRWVEKAGTPLKIAHTICVDITTRIV